MSLIFSDEEIEKAKELKRLKLLAKLSSAGADKIFPQVGSYLWARSCPPNCKSLSQENIFLILEVSDEISEGLWLPTLDEILWAAKKLDVSFSQVTDFLHRRRFADGRERVGIYQLLIEKLR